jgi:hypothetical protein
MNIETQTPAARLATLVEGQAYMKVGRSLFFRLLDSGEITRVRIGRRAFVTVASMEAFIDRLEAEAAAGAA